MKKNINSALFIIVLLLIAPLNKADTIQIVNYRT